jgi:hypothetical protein
MTYIAKPVVADSAILNHVARDLLVPTDDPMVINLRRSLKVVTEDGVIHDLTFEQVDGLVNILDLSRETPLITPLQYLVTAYNLEDLVQMGRDGWAVTEYSIQVLHLARTVRLDGVLHKEGSVDKEFTFALGEFDFVQQFSLSRVISAQREELKVVAGTFDMSYTFAYDPQGFTLQPHEEATPNEA